MTVRIEESSTSRLDDHPNETDQNLHADKGQSDKNLRFWANVSRPLSSMASGVENSRYPISFGQKGSIDSGESSTDQKPLGDARPQGWNRDQDECIHITQEYTAEQQIT